MSSSTLFKIAGGILFALPVGHIKMYLDTLVPHLKSLGTATGAYASKVSWNQANGYFIVSSLLCFKWANEGVSQGFESYMLAVLIATQCFAGLSYMKKGVPGPAVAYLTASFLMGIAAWKQA